MWSQSGSDSLIIAFVVSWWNFRKIAPLDTWSISQASSTLSFSEEVGSRTVQKISFISDVSKLSSHCHPQTFSFDRIAAYVGKTIFQKVTLTFIRSEKIF